MVWCGQVPRPHALKGFDIIPPALPCHMYHQWVECAHELNTCLRRSSPPAHLHFSRSTPPANQSARPAAAAIERPRGRSATLQSHLQRLKSRPCHCAERKCETAAPNHRPQAAQTAIVGSQITHRSGIAPSKSRACHHPQRNRETTAPSKGRQRPKKRLRAPQIRCPNRPHAVQNLKLATTVDKSAKQRPQAKSKQLKTMPYVSPMGRMLMD